MYDMFSTEMSLSQVEESLEKHLAYEIGVIKEETEDNLKLVEQEILSTYGASKIHLSLAECDGHHYKRRFRYALKSHKKSWRTLTLQADELLNEAHTFVEMFPGADLDTVRDALNALFRKMDERLLATIWSEHLRLLKAHYGADVVDAAMTSFLESQRPS
jgi:hypothetical protein